MFITSKSTIFEMLCQRCVMLDINKICVIHSNGAVSMEPIDGNSKIH